MGRYCRLCGRARPNEKFSGKGHRIGICKECKKMPTEEKERRFAREELDGYLEQSNISLKNISRLKVLARSKDQSIGDFAQLLLEIAEVKPHKRRRFKWLAKNRRDLLKRLKEHLGFVDIFEEEDVAAEEDVFNEDFFLTSFKQRVKKRKTFYVLVNLWSKFTEGYTMKDRA
jgi:hypothetical protein